LTAGGKWRRPQVGKSILVIDDEETILDSVEILLEDMGHEVATFSDPAAGLAEALDHPFDLVVVDVKMPGMNGAEVTERLLKARPTARVLVVTAFPDDPLAVRALGTGAVGLLKKPFPIVKILDFLA
jgi:FixJ family two-component response regulator